MVRITQLAVLLVAFSLNPSPAGGEPGDLAPIKIAVHLEPHTTGTPGEICDLAPSSYGCFDYHTGPQALTTDGDLGIGYQVYLVAVDVPSAVGLSSVQFQIHYEPAASQQGLLVGEWTLCADRESPSATWPEPGSTNTVSFDACAATVPDPEDPEGDGYAVLGSFYVYAYSRTWFGIGGHPDRPQEFSPVAVNCAGAPTTVEGFPAGVGVGSAGFDAGGHDPCHAFIIDGGCVFNGTPWGFCCGDSATGCLRGLADASPRACEYAGGTWTIVPCSVAPFCADAVCEGTPARHHTWGAIKARYR